MKKFDYEEDEWEEEEEPYSPTMWEKDPFETDEEYRDRIQDQEDLIDSWND